MNSSKSRQPGNLAPTQAQRFLAELANLRPEPDATARFLRQFAAFIPERKHPFAAVETLPYRERQQDGTHVASSEPALRAAEALRTGKYGVAPPEHPTPDASAGAIGPPRVGDQPYQPARSDTDTPGRGIPRGSPPRPIDSAEQEAEWIWTLHTHLCRIWDQPDYRTRQWGGFLLLHLARGEAGSRHLTLLGFPGPLPPPTLFEQALMWFVDVGDRARHCPNPDCVAPYFFAARRSQKYCADICARPSQREFKRRWWAEHGSARRKSRTRHVTKAKKGR